MILRGMGNQRLTMSGRAIIARLLAVAFLLAALLVSPFAEAAPGGAPQTTVVSAATDQDGGPGKPSGPHGILHAGCHCNCHLADRMAPLHPVARTAPITVDHSAFTESGLASLEARPPARPPRT